MTSKVISNKLGTMNTELDALEQKIEQMVRYGLIHKPKELMVELVERFSLAFVYLPSSGAPCARRIWRRVQPSARF